MTAAVDDAWSCPNCKAPHTIDALDEFDPAEVVERLFPEEQRDYSPAKSDLEEEEVPHLATAPCASPVWTVVGRRGHKTEADGTRVRRRFSADTHMRREKMSTRRLALLDDHARPRATSSDHSEKTLSLKITEKKKPPRHGA